MYQKILTGVVLGICSGTDIKCRKIYKGVAAGYLLLALAGHLIGKTMSLSSLLSGLIPGGCCLLLSWATRQSFGYGDSVLAGICGVSLGVRGCTEILLLAFLGSGIWAMILFVFRRAGRKKEFPFVPFLFLGWIIWQTAGGG